MLINLKTSKKNKQVVTELTRKLNLGTENIISRIAFAYSLSKNIKLKLSNIQDSQGKEYKDDILFGRYRDYYIALICQHYNLYKTDKDIGKYIKSHIDHGLELIHKFFENNKNYIGFDFLIENIERGIEVLEDTEISLGAVDNYNQKIDKEYFSDLIQLNVGKEIDNNNPIYLNINDVNIYNNYHIAVAGNTGTGKTQFALDLLTQIVKHSNNKINFIYLDFKGLKKDDLKHYKPFFNKTKSTYIDAPHTAFPLNPLSFIDHINEKNKILGINKFVDIIAHYSNIGKVQKQILKDATKEVFIEKKEDEYPSIKDIFEKVCDITGDKQDTLREILENLSELELFKKKVDNKNNFLLKNYYFSLSGELPDSVRLTATFLIINYIYNTFMNMENTPVENNIKSIRYVFVIDEAHVIFKDRKSQEILEKILREIRSKGVSVILLSQGITEFNQPNFDFSSMCEIAFLLDIKDKTNLRVINKFLGFGERESKKVARSLEKIQKGQVVSNIKEFKKGELFKISQFIKKQY